MNRRADDDAWLNALAGRPANEIDPGSALEAQLLRGALLRSADPATAAVPPTEAEERHFLRRLERERAAGGCVGCAERGARWKAWWAQRWLPIAGALASLTLAAVILRPQVPPLSEPPVLRGNASAVQLRTDAQPQRLRDELARRLAALGAQTQRYERLGRFGIDARFATPLTPSVARELQALGVLVDADGVVRVEFEDSAR